MESQEKVWDSIARSWFERKKTLFPNVEKFLADKKGKILDIGCGSGRNFSAIIGEIFGVDFSAEMLKIAKQTCEKLGKKCVLNKANADELPFENNFFDAAIFVAALHCIESASSREKSLLELKRVLRPGARAFVTVWSSSHERIKGTGDQWLPWGTEKEKVMRFCYVYTKEEFKDLLERCGLKVVSLEENENIVAIVEKV